MFSPVTIGFSTQNRFLSRIIRWVTQSPCSHAWFCYNGGVVGVTQHIKTIAEAEWFGYRTIPRWRWDKRNKCIAEFELVGPPALSAIHEMIDAYLGAKYDYKAALLVGLWRLLGRSLRGKFQDPLKLMCSEGVIRMLNRAGYRTVKNLDPEITSPKRLMVRCFQNPQEFKLLHASHSVRTRFK